MRTLFAIPVAVAMGLASFVPAFAGAKTCDPFKAEVGLPTPESVFMRGAGWVAKARIDEPKLCKEPIIKTFIECQLDFQVFVSATIRFTNKRVTYLLERQSGKSEAELEPLRREVDELACRAIAQGAILNQYQSKKTSRLETGDGK